MAPFDHSDPVFAGRSALHPAPAPIPAEVIVLDIGGSGRAGAQAPGFGADARLQVIMLRPGPGGLPDLWSPRASARRSRRRPPRIARATRLVGCAWLDLEAARLTDEAGRDIPATAMEFNLLKLFARNRGRVLTRDRDPRGRARPAVAPVTLDRRPGSPHPPQSRGEPGEARGDPHRAGDRLHPPEIVRASNAEAEFTNSTLY